MGNNRCTIAVRKESTKPKSISNNGQMFKPGAVSLRKFRIQGNWDGNDKVLLECAEGVAGMFREVISLIVPPRKRGI